MSENPLQEPWLLRAAQKIKFRYTVKGQSFQVPGRISRVPQGKKGDIVSEMDFYAPRRTSQEVTRGLLLNDTVTGWNNSLRTPRFRPFPEKRRAAQRAMAVASYSDAKKTRVLKACWGPGDCSSFVVVKMACTSAPISNIFIRGLEGLFSYSK